MTSNNNPYKQSLEMAHIIFKRASDQLENSLKKPIDSDNRLTQHEAHVKLYHGAEVWLEHVSKLHAAFENGVLYIDPTILSPEAICNLLKEVTNQEPPTTNQKTNQKTLTYPREWQAPELHLLKAARQRYLTGQISDYPDVTEAGH